MKMTFRLGSGLVLLSPLLLIAACDPAPTSQASSTSSGSDSQEGIVARVGDREITLAEVDEKALQSNMSAYQEVYNARKQAIEELVADALLEQEARERGISQEELVAREITPKVGDVTEEDVGAFYEQNRGRLGGQTLEQIGGQIRDFLAARNEAAARQSFLDELRARSDVDVSLDPPRIPIRVARGERIRGPSDAPVTIVEYSDFQ